MAHTFLIWQVLSMFAHLFPDLLARSFVDEFVTPLVKCTKGKSEKAFYTQVVMRIIITIFVIIIIIIITTRLLLFCIRRNTTRGARPCQLPRPAGVTSTTRG